MCPKHSGRMREQCLQSLTKSYFDGFELPGGCCEALCILLHKISMLWNPQETAVTTVPMLSNLQECHETPSAHFSDGMLRFWIHEQAAMKSVLVVWNPQSSRVTPFAQFCYETSTISMLLECTLALRNKCARGCTTDPTQKWFPTMCTKTFRAHARRESAEPCQLANSSELLQVVCVGLGTRLLRSHYVRFGMSRSLL